MLGGTPTGTARLWRALAPATADWAPGTAATQVVDALLAPDDLVLPRHHGLFPTLDSELLPVLRGLGVQTIVLTGVSLNLAITHTAGHATQAGFELVVPRDAVGGTPSGYAEQVLSNTIAVLGRLTTVDDLIAEWAESDASRRLSAERVGTEIGNVRSQCRGAGHRPVEPRGTRELFDGEPAVALPRDAVPPGTAQVKLGDSATGTSDAVVCTPVASSTIIKTGDDAAGTTSTVTNADTLAVASVDIRNIAGFTGSQWTGVARRRQSPHEWSDIRNHRNRQGFHRRQSERNRDAALRDHCVVLATTARRE